MFTVHWSLFSIEFKNNQKKQKNKLEKISMLGMYSFEKKYIKSIYYSII